MCGGSALRSLLFFVGVMMICAFGYGLLGVMLPPPEKVFAGNICYVFSVL